MKRSHRLARLPEEKVSDKITRRVLSGDRVMLSWWSVKAGAYAPPHSHPYEVFASPREDFLGTAPAPALFE